MCRYQTKGGTDSRGLNIESCSGLPQRYHYERKTQAAVATIASEKTMKLLSLVLALLDCACNGSEYERIHRRFQMRSHA